MSKLKNTPGPWYWNDFYKAIQSTNGELKAICVQGKNNENDYDMQLIAAAPEMLNRLLSVYIHGANDSNMKRALRETIEKATGIKIEDVLK